MKSPETNDDLLVPSSPNMEDLMSGILEKEKAARRRRSQEEETANRRRRSNDEEMANRRRRSNDEEMANRSRRSNNEEISNRKRRSGDEEIYKEPTYYAPNFEPEVKSEEQQPSESAGYLGLISLYEHARKRRESSKEDEVAEKERKRRHLPGLDWLFGPDATFNSIIEYERNALGLNDPEPADNYREPYYEDADEPSLFGFLHSQEEEQEQPSEPGSTWFQPLSFLEPYEPVPIYKAQPGPTVKSTEYYTSYPEPEPEPETTYYEPEPEPEPETTYYETEPLA